MPFSIQCTHKGCFQLMEPYLDPKDDKVYCSLCNQELTNITHFVKIQMKSLKQYRKDEPKSFAIKCPNCGKKDRPLLTPKDIVCAACKKPLTQLSEPFKIMLRENLKTADKDI